MDVTFVLSLTNQCSRLNLGTPNGAIEKRIQMWKKYPEAGCITNYKIMLMFDGRNLSFEGSLSLVLQLYQSFLSAW